MSGGCELRARARDILTAVAEGDQGHKALSADELLTVEQRGEFLDALRQGIPPGLAARAITVPEGTPVFTGTKLRGCRRRDPVFEAECAAAMVEGAEFYRERLCAAARTKALDPKGSDRILEVELATNGGTEYAHLRRDRMVVDAKVEHAIVFDPAALEAMSLERLIEFRSFLAELGGGIVTDAEFAELPEITADG